MARSKRGLWFKFGRFITGITIICFFLPFFGVSCGGMDVITVSGTDMVGGCKPGGLISDAEEKKAKHHGADDGMSDMNGDVKVTGNVEREPLAIIALALAIVVFGLSWVRTRGALIAACVVSIMCLGTLVGLYLKVGRELSAEVDKELKKENTGSQMMKEAEVDAGSRYGLWITCLSLIGIAAITGLAWREPEGSENLPPSPQRG
jgi:hypothetical protein